MTVTVVGTAYDSKTKVRATTDWIAIHCSATTDKMNIGAVELNEWHRKRGFACIGYHYVIRRDGTIERGRAKNVIGAHVEGYNSNSVGVCMVGGVEANDVSKAENNFTEVQFEKLHDLLVELKGMYPKAIIQGHKDFPHVAKACPSFEVKAWLKENVV
jgi:N-acetylmuramoyl-L-alanine amidase